MPCRVGRVEGARWDSKSVAERWWNGGDGAASIGFCSASNARCLAAAGVVPSRSHGFLERLGVAHALRDSAYLC